MADDEVVGCVGTLLSGTRDDNGAGEASVQVRGGTETFLAYSDAPLPRGTRIIVAEAISARAVRVMRMPVEPLPELRPLGLFAAPAPLPPAAAAPMSGEPPTANRGGPADQRSDADPPAGDTSLEL